MQGSAAARRTPEWARSLPLPQLRPASAQRTQRAKPPRHIANCTQRTAVASCAPEWARSLPLTTPPCCPSALQEQRLPAPARNSREVARAGQRNTRAHGVNARVGVHAGQLRQLYTRAASPQRRRVAQADRVRRRLGAKLSTIIYLRTGARAGARPLPLRRSAPVAARCGARSVDV